MDTQLFITVPNMSPVSSRTVGDATIPCGPPLAFHILQDSGEYYGHITLKVPDSI